MKIRMKINIDGAAAGYTDLRRGQLIDVDERTATQFLQCGYAQADLGELRQAYKPEAVPKW